MIVQTVLKSPLVHFFVLGGLIFAAFSVLDDAAAPSTQDEIILTSAEASRLVDQFFATWRRPPTEVELDALMQAWALEEAHVREALVLGLDRGDAVIRQRLAVKMQFLAESGAAGLAADDGLLQAHLDANRDRFETPVQYSFDQVLMTTGDAAEIEATGAALRTGADPAGLGKASLLPFHVPLTPAPALDRMFGTGFAAALAAVPRSGWQGPVESAYGLHLVRVGDRTEAALPALGEIRDRVEEDWRAAQGRRMREAFGQALLDRYGVSLPPAAEVLAR